MSAIGIAGFGYYDSTGIGGSGGVNRRDVPSIDDVKWRDVSESTFKRFGQLDALSKAAMIATEMIGADRFSSIGKEDIVGVSMGTREGCLGTDIDFRESTRERAIANPRLFAYTLPSTVCGDLAIRYGLLGPNACFQGGSRSGWLAIHEGYHLIKDGEADACLCLSVDALFYKSWQTAKNHDMLEGIVAFQACAFLLTRESASQIPPLCRIDSGQSEYQLEQSDGALRNLCRWIETNQGSGACVDLVGDYSER